MSDLQFISTIPSSTSQRPEQLHEATQERQKTLTKRGSTPRTQRLRDISESTHPSISLERALIETDVYRKYEGKVPTPVLRGLFFNDNTHLTLPTTETVKISVVAESLKKKGVGG
ncbi:MAG: hypothetical protein ABF451_03395, partial [Bifidobacterium aquikefiri]|uniref:hypothetical protein n=1 Tax=Bifidobacterium aquikefiri TaxID=1653207 RepID=UPI0039E9E71F